MIVDGLPLSGAAGYAGEVGHMPVNPSGSACRCGSFWLLGNRGRRRGPAATRRPSGGGWPSGGRGAAGRGCPRDPRALAAIAVVGRWLAFSAWPGSSTSSTRAWWSSGACSGASIRGSRGLWRRSWTASPCPRRGTRAGRARHAGGGCSAARGGRAGPRTLPGRPSRVDARSGGSAASTQRLNVPSWRRFDRCSIGATRPGPRGPANRRCGPGRYVMRVPSGIPVLEERAHVQPK